MAGDMALVERSDQPGTQLVRRSPRLLARRLENLPKPVTDSPVKKM